MIRIRPVLAAAPLVWCCSLLAGLHVYEGRLLESVLDYGIFSVDSRAFCGTAGGWEMGDTSAICRSLCAFWSLLCAVFVVPVCS